MKRLLAGVAVACLLAACSHPTHPTASSPALSTVTNPTAPASLCPAGASTMGCSVPHTLGTVLGAHVPSGPLVPDVSMWQGPNINWSAVRSWQRSHHWKLQGGMIKLGETGYGRDPDMLINAQRMHALGMVVIGYWFVRAGTSVSEVISAARAAGVHLVVLDEEVPGIQGDAAKLTPALRKAGLAVGDYHSASNVFDTSAQGLPCDVAAYGPSTAPGCSTGPVMGWQFTDGQWGQTVNVPGIGYGDVSASRYMLRLGEKPAKPKPAKCWGHGAHPKWKACRPIVARYSQDVKNGKHWWKLAREIRKAHS